MYFDIISSGSKGNATLIFDGGTLILIDMGITLKRLEETLKKYNKKINDIDACLFTHDHTDHISGVRFLKTNKMYACEGVLTSPNSNVVEINKPFFINNIKITPVPTSHDAENPCGYVLEGSKKLVYITDTGKLIEDSLEVAKDPTYLLIESNHDIQMLIKSTRPFDLKMRILSEYGHLSNEDSALAAISLIGKNTKEIVLMHLSEECNTPQKAVEAYRKIFEYYQIDIDKYELKCARQWENVTGGKFNEN